MVYFRPRYLQYRRANPNSSVFGLLWNGVNARLPSTFRGSTQNTSINNQSNPDTFNNSINASGRESTSRMPYKKAELMHASLVRSSRNVTFSQQPHTPATNAPQQDNAIPEIEEEEEKDEEQEEIQSTIVVQGAEEDHV